MVCRQFQVSSVVIAQTRTASWLEDDQIQSLSHAALHQSPEYEAPFAGLEGGVWAAVVRRARRDLAINPAYRDQRRRGLVSRLEAGVESEVARIPPERLMAMWRLPQVVAESQRQLTARLALIAASRGMSEREIFAEYQQLRAAAPRGRQARATAAEVADLGLIPADPATRFALRELASRPPLRPPVRLVDRWTPVARRATDDDRPAVLSLGTSSTDDYLECRYSDGSVRSFRTGDGVRSMWLLPEGQAAVSEADVALIVDASRLADSRDGFRIHCPACGQFVGSAPHECVERRSMAALEMHSRALAGGGTIEMADPIAIRNTIASDLTTSGSYTEVNGSQLPARVHIDDAEVTGEVTVRPLGSAVRSASESPQSLDFDDAGLGDTLTCSLCHSSSCLHCGMARTAIRRRLGETSLRVANPETVPRLDAYLARVREPEPAAAPAPIPAPAVELVSFVDNVDAFREAARARFGGSPSLLFEARDGVLATPGVRFGVELEFGGSAGVARRVADQLHGHGLLARPQQARYHTAARQGHSRWVLESDCTVTGELVTPILSDDEASWRQLQQACTTIRDSGATFRGAGSHTNISAAGFGFDDAMRLVWLARTFEDDIYRMGRNRQARGDQARGLSYAHPLNDPSHYRHHRPRWVSVEGLGGHGAMINFGHATGDSSSRIEFRFPDASHDESVIQAQVALCTAMTTWARGRGDGDLDWDRPRHELGSNLEDRATLQLFSLGAEEFEQRTRPVRELIDLIGTTGADRSRFASLWGLGAYRRYV